MSTFGNESGGNDQGDKGKPHQPQKVTHAPMSARVPEKVAKGVVATGFLTYFGPQEFVIDFLQFISRPAHLAARVVMAPAVAEQFVQVLRDNLSRYTANFGAPATLPRNPSDKPRSPQEIYDDLKVPDDLLSGVYANAVIVGHTPAEFGIDFVTNFIPNAAISARVYLAAPRVPQLIETLSNLVAQYQKQRQPQGPSFGTAPGIPGFPAPASPPAPPLPPTSGGYYPPAADGPSGQGGPVPGNN